MVPKPKHDIYLQTTAGKSVKIAWLHEFKDFELMIGFYGFGGEDPVLAYEYPDKIATSAEMGRLQIAHRDAVQKGNIPIDHFTFHKDQKHRPGIFHLRYGEEPKHVLKFKGNLDEKSPIILDFIILSDEIEKYADAITNPDSTDIVFVINPGEAVSLRGRYCGKDFDLESVLQNEAREAGVDSVDAVAYQDKMLKCYFGYQTLKFNDEATKNKNVGTHFFIHFPLDGDRSLVKAFIFN